MRIKKDRKIKVMNKEARSSQVYYSKICQTEDDFLRMHNDARLKMPKRADPFGSSHHKSKKVKLAEIDCSQSQRRSFEKVDAFEGNKYIQEYSFARISEPNESDTDQCSVGSCSVPSDGYKKLSSEYDADVLSSDGESLNTSRVEHEIAVSIHRLELNAYQATLEALFASGPLSWEKEALLTNLRINLHISNDEHLTELRHLITSGARILDK